MNSPASSIAATQMGQEQILPRHHSKPRLTGKGLLHVWAAIAAIVLSAILLVFLAALQTDFGPAAPTLSIRTLDTSQGPVSGPPPPPPSQISTPQSESPPQPIALDLPKLNLDLTHLDAPAVTAQIDKKLDLSLIKSDFSTEGQVGSFGSIGGVLGAGRPSMTFSGKDLDSQPRLINKPSFTFPERQRKNGVEEGTVKLEIRISSSGRVSILRVLSSSHNDFTVIARSYATKALFTPPKNDGRPVSSTFTWPLTFKLNK